MTSSHPTGSADALTAALAAQAACVPLERFGDALTTAERAHVDACPRCRAELALWHRFNDSTPAADDGAAVQWVVAELRRRRGHPGDAPGRARWWRAWLSVPRLSAAALTVALLAVIGGYVTWDRDPILRGVQNAKATYRSSAVRVLSPVGDLRVRPTVLEWENVPGAERYDVTVREVDRTTIWQATSSGTRIEMPSSLIDRFVPGKTVLWEVTARTAAGASIATSGTQQFRVTVTIPGE